jgi:dTMP kinase
MKEVKTQNRGLFIVFEGLDGAGTTTQLDLINRSLTNKGEKVYITKEPTDSMIGGLIRSLLKKHWEIGAEGAQLLFAADRAYHLDKEIIPILSNGTAIITDRYYFSSIAYGSVSIEDTEWIEAINSRFLKPDLVIYVCVSAEQAIGRIEEGRCNEKELFEKKEMLEKVKEAYDKLADEFDYFVSVDGSKSKEEVTQDILKVLKEKLNLG